MEDYVPLDRQFSPVSKNQEETEYGEILLRLGHVKPKTWDDMDREFRCIILAEAGAGKTEELKKRASLLAKQGKPSFFIRIEDIESDFYNAFEVGDETQFHAWLKSTEEAWFFLDSVDEARLINVNSFRNALRRFAAGIKNSAHRAHIYISSRPYAWRPRDDRRLMDEILFLPTTEEERDVEDGRQSAPSSALRIYTMRPLDEERIRRFCEGRKVNDIEGLLRGIGRANLWNLAERPFDLDSILAKWAEDRVLGGRLELLRHYINRQLSDEHNCNREQRHSLNLERAREGAQRLAAAVVLTGQAGINVLDSASIKPGIEAQSVLADWEKQDVHELLERGIFNDIIYRAVRFRHREVRELLAAEWFDGLLRSGNSRHSVEALFFREQYGEKIITPRLRPVLPWLILFDDEIRRKAIELQPEITVEGGDPSKLPKEERQRILADIVHRIVSNTDGGSARDNSAIARIANSDLSEDTMQLINIYGHSDEAVFFLGRLVWQGEMASCVAPFLDIALDHSMGIYARIASVCAVMTCGTDDQKQCLWRQLNENDEQIPYDLFSELVQEAPPNSDSVTQLIISLNKLPPYKPYETNDVDHSLHKFIERVPIVGDQHVITQLIEGLHSYLQRPPYVEHRECHVSVGNAWLLSPATHAVERLVEARSPAAFETTALSIMLMVPVLRVWRSGEFSEHKGNLQALVPSWPELNDALYWASIDHARIYNTEKSNGPITNDWLVSWLGHFWKFDMAGLPRLLDYMCFRELQDDRLVALSTAFRVYVQADRPAHILSSLQDAVTDDAVLRHQLNILLNPQVSEVVRISEEKHAEYLRKCEEEEERKRRDRDLWIADLRANSDRVRNPPNLEPGELSADQYWLMHEIRGYGLKTNRTKSANWQALIPDFGDAVAHAYRDAAINYWRFYKPTLQSEGVKRDNTIPYSLIFAMAGLEIDAAEVADFPHHLNEPQVRRALRYITWECNRFPRWFERIFKAFPDLVIETVIQELLWELENAGADYILRKLVYHAPWLHDSMAPVVLEWMEANPTNINANRYYCLHILVNGGVEPVRLAKIAEHQIAMTNEIDSIAWWYALRVDSDPVMGISEIEQWLSGLEEKVAIHAAQVFIVALMGDGHLRQSGPYFNHFQTAEYLKSIYILMHRYIRTIDDNNRASGVAYTPTFRDEAQHARDRLFHLLSKIPGKESFISIKALSHEHPDPGYRPWMARQAYKRAEEDGDIEPWSAEQVFAFHKDQFISPKTHRQLFDLAVHRLIDLKNWVERGNDSPWQTWQRAEGETEMRKLIAGWLNQKCRYQYTTAQESELANSQRMDIWFQNIYVQSPVPIELKLLDKGWTGPKLCERLRNQLAGDYLREEGACCGVMLLVSQQLGHEKRWQVNGQRVGLIELASAMKHYWQGISDRYPGVEDIEVIVIDLTKREKVSNS